MGDELNDYYLVRDILKLRLNSSVEKLFSNVTKGFMPAIITAIITTVVINNIEVNIIMQSLLYLAIIMLFIIYIVASISFSFLRKKNRIEILLLTLERIIKEEEKNL